MSLAVVGGTGRYAGLSGEVTLTPSTVSSQTGSLAKFTFTDDWADCPRLRRRLGFVPTGPLAGSIPAARRVRVAGCRHALAQLKAAADAQDQARRANSATRAAMAGA